METVHLVEIRDLTAKRQQVEQFDVPVFYWKAKTADTMLKSVALWVCFSQDKKGELLMASDCGMFIYDGPAQSGPASASIGLQMKGGACSAKRVWDRAARRSILPTRILRNCASR